MTANRARARRAPTPLGAAQLDEMALAYVARFATSRARLLAYLGRKLRERGWAGEAPPQPEAIADRMVRLGYVDDAAYARAKARSLGARGYGARRVNDGLRAAGIAESQRGEAIAMAEEGRIVAIVRFARRRRLGPYAMADDEGDPRRREKAIGAMVRAGHDPGLARLVAGLAAQPGLNEEEIAEMILSRL